MKRILMLVVILFFVAIPFSVEAVVASHSILYTPCIASDGTYQLTVTAIINEAPGFDSTLSSQVDQGSWVNHGQVQNGWMHIYTGLSEWTWVRFQYKVDDVSYDIQLIGNGYPECPKSSAKGATPLFQMWLLTKQNSVCILISELHPSVERQKALCLPGKEWVAENELCNGWVYDNGIWDCDIYGFNRLPFPDLYKIYKRHAARLE